MTVLTICNHKGGTGKTTTSIHVAAALGLSGYRTLVLDLDPQAFLTRMLGVDEPDPRHSVLALFDAEGLREAQPRQLRSFDLLPASSRMTHAMRKLNRPTDVLWAKETLQQDLGYDIILFDTAAAVTVFSLNALVASQHVLVPVMPEYQPVLGAEQTYRTVEQVREKLNPDLQMPLFLFTMVDARKSTHHRFRAYLRRAHGDRVMNTIIRTSAALSVQHRDGSTTFDHDPHARGARDYANATDELLRHFFPPEPEDAAGRLEQRPAVAPPVPAPRSPQELL